MTALCTAKNHLHVSIAFHINNCSSATKMLGTHKTISARYSDVTMHIHILGIMVHLDMQQI